MEKNLEEFKTYLLERNHSRRTIATYTKAVEQFLTLINKTPETIQYSDIGKYTLWCKEVIKFSNNGLIPKYGAIKSYLWFIKYKYGNTTIDSLNENRITMSILKPPKRKYPQKDLLTKEEIFKLFKVASINPRDVALLKTFYYTTQRVSSIRELNVQDIDFKNEEIWIHGKGDSSYTVDIHTDALKSIKLYLDWREIPEQTGYVLDNYGRKLYHKDALFLNNYGK